MAPTSPPGGDPQGTPITVEVTAPAVLRRTAQSLLLYVLLRARGLLTIPL